MHPAAVGSPPALCSFDKQLAVSCRFQDSMAGSSGGVSRGSPHARQDGRDRQHSQPSAGDLAAAPLPPVHRVMLRPFGPTSRGAGPRPPEARRAVAGDDAEREVRGAV
jgi:hypothetical protein